MSRFKGNSLEAFQDLGELESTVPLKVIVLMQQPKLQIILNGS
jgi:hypothetical protein